MPKFKKKKKQKNHKTNKNIMLSFYKQFNIPNINLIYIAKLPLRNHFKEFKGFNFYKTY